MKMHAFVSNWCNPAACFALLAIMFMIPSATRAQWKATVGAQSEDLGRQVLAFLPNEIWIHQGDTITWVFAAAEIHTVSFLLPGQVRLPFQAGCPGFVAGDSAIVDGKSCVTTNAPPTGGPNFTVTFTNAGNYKLVCLVHQNMTGVIHVLAANAKLPHDQAYYDEVAAREAEQLLSQAARNDDNEEEHHHSGHVTAGRGKVLATGGGSETVSVMRFMEDKTVIHAGDTVEWTNDDPITPHTITFGAEPQGNPTPPSANVKTDADGGLHATISSTSDNVHSGFIVAAPQERIGLAQAPIGTTHFRVTFTKAGKYPYICVLHDDLGMKGVMVVLP